MLLYTYISRFSVTPHYIKSGRVAATNAVPQPFLIAVSTSLTNGPRLLSRVKVGTHLGSLRKIAHSGSQGETGVLWMGALSLPSDRFARSGNPAWPEGRTAYLAPFGSWPGVLPKNAESLRDSDALMRVAVPKASRPRWAARLFYFCLNCGLYALRSGPFRVCETRGGITTLGVLCVLLKRRTAACQSGSFAVF